ncbi:MAG: CvpA family protein [Chloroflexota bacterium]|nr:CvpA family protein [Chloroflexota bacterium]
MRELINFIPYLDLLIIGLLLMFIYIGWNGGIPKQLMVMGSVYTGFLLATIYYHLFAVMVGGMMKITVTFVTNLISFLALDVLITVIMLALMLNLFGHVEVKGRLAAFDKLIGSTLGFLTGILVVGIVVTILRVPYQENQLKPNLRAEVPAVQVFDAAYEKSALAPTFMRAAPYLLYSVVPMLPPETRSRGAVPLLESIVAHK